VLNPDLRLLSLAAQSIKYLAESALSSKVLSRNSIIQSVTSFDLLIRRPRSCGSSSFRCGLPEIWGLIGK
jgi:hypothetical protein